MVFLNCNKRTGKGVVIGAALTSTVQGQGVGDNSRGYAVLSCNAVRYQLSEELGAVGRIGSWAAGCRIDSRGITSDGVRCVLQKHIEEARANVI